MITVAEKTNFIEEILNRILFISQDEFQKKITTDKETIHYFINNTNESFFVTNRFVVDIILLHISKNKEYSKEDANLINLLNFLIVAIKKEMDNDLNFQKSKLKKEKDTTETLKLEKIDDTGKFIDEIKPIIETKIDDQKIKTSSNLSNLLNKVSQEVEIIDKKKDDIENTIEIDLEEKNNVKEKEINDLLDNKDKISELIENNIVKQDKISELINADETKEKISTKEEIVSEISIKQDEISNPLLAMKDKLFNKPLENFSSLFNKKQNNDEKNIDIVNENNEIKEVNKIDPTEIMEKILKKSNDELPSTFDSIPDYIEDNNIENKKETIVVETKEIEDNLKNTENYDIDNQNIETISYDLEDEEIDYSISYEDEYYYESLNNNETFILNNEDIESIDNNEIIDNNLENTNDKIESIEEDDSILLNELLDEYDNIEDLNNNNNFNTLTNEEEYIEDKSLENTYINDSEYSNEETLIENNITESIEEDNSILLDELLNEYDNIDNIEDLSNDKENNFINETKNSINSEYSNEKTLIENNIIESIEEDNSILLDELLNEYDNIEDKSLENTYINDSEYSNEETLIENNITELIEEDNSILLDELLNEYDNIEDSNLLEEHNESNFIENKILTKDAFIEVININNNVESTNKKSIKLVDSFESSNNEIKSIIKNKKENVNINENNISKTLDVFDLIDFKSNTQTELIDFKSNEFDFFDTFVDTKPNIEIIDKKENIPLSLEEKMNKMELKIESLEKELNELKNLIKKIN